MSRRIIAGLLVLVASLAAAAVPATAKKPKHKPAPAVVPGNYSGTYDGGTVKLAVAPNGKSVKNGTTFSALKYTCADGSSFVESQPLEFHAIPITGRAFHFHSESDGYVYDLQGTFTKDGKVTGTVSAHMPPPPTPPGFVDVQGACDTGAVAFTAKKG